jgi:guanylate kinase
MAKIQPLVDFVSSFDMPEHLKKVLDLITGDHEDERSQPKKTIEEVANEIERDEARCEQLAREKGLPMTQEEYEERKKKRGLSKIR